MTGDLSGRGTSSRPSVRLPVDGHVHFHHCRHVVPTLDAALDNLQRVSGRTQGLVGALLLTQARAEHVFEELISRSALNTWTLTAAAGEPETLVARKGETALAIVCGRQIRVEAGLEVLALGTREEFAEGQPLAVTIDHVCRAGAVIVLPWGFAKWLGRRGELVRAALVASGKECVFIGDNGSRMAAAARPAIIREFEQLGYRIVPGTDPFPFGRDFRRVGTFGFLADVAGHAEAPWRAIRASLTSNPASPQPFGRACRPVRFVSNQIGIQIYNRFFRSVAA